MKPSIIMHHKAYSCHHVCLLMHVHSILLIIYIIIYMCYVMCLLHVYSLM